MVPREHGWHGRRGVRLGARTGFPGDHRYPPRMLISADALRDRLDDSRLRIADVRWFLGEPGRGRRDYESGHLPGAIFVDVDADLVAPDGPGRHPLPSPEAFAA